MAKKVKKEKASIEERLKALHKLQVIDSEIDNIRIVRGELPLEIQELMLIVEGLGDKLNKAKDDLDSIEEQRTSRKSMIKEAKALIKKYKKQLENIKNNREFTSLTKEVEFQTLEIELCEKKIKEAAAQIGIKEEIVDAIKAQKKEKNSELKLKQKELDNIVKETEKDEKSLLRKSKKAQEILEEALLNLYHKIRTKVRNGLAVVSIDRDACGGCFNRIPPQRQLDIQLHKKIIFCEHCGRVLIGSEPSS